MEIEQKFLLNYYPKDLSKYECKEIIQGYLATGPVVRIRKSNDRYILTYKSKGIENGDKSGVCISNELEAPLTKEVFEHLLPKCDGIIIKKKRYIIPLEKEDVGIEGLKAELDVFEDILEGLSFAEVEFQNVTDCERFNKPDWLGLNVSDDKKYRNNFLTTIKGREHFLQLFNLNGGNEYEI